MLKHNVVNKSINDVETVGKNKAVTVYIVFAKT